MTIDLLSDDIGETDPEIEKSMIVALKQSNENQAVEVTLFRQELVFSLNKMEAAIIADALTCHVQEWNK